MNESILGGKTKRRHNPKYQESLFEKYYPLLLLGPAFSILKGYWKILDQGGDPWMTGDWLINYAGGFIRRGWTGHILYTITESAEGLLLATGLLQMVMFVAIIVMVIVLFCRVPLTSRRLMLLFSPAFVLFTWYDLTGGLRKEMMVFVSFLILLLPFSRKGISGFNLFLSLSIYAIAAVSHEIVAFCVYFFLYILWHSMKLGQISRTAMTIGMAGYAGFAVASVIIGFLFQGDSTSGGAICRSLLERGLNDQICAGAVAAISSDNRYWLDVIFQRSSIYHINTALLLALSLIPLVMTNPITRHMYFLIFGFSSMVPLFFLGADWGRWLHIYIVLSTLSLVTLSIRNPQHEYSIPWGFALIYIALWNIPHFLLEDIGFGLAGKLLQLI